MRVGVIGSGRIGAAVAGLAAAAGHDVAIANTRGPYDDLPAAELTGKVVLDAGNYYPERDGRIAALDDGSTTSSELLAARLPGAHVVKAFNTQVTEREAAALLA